MSLLRILLAVVAAILIVWLVPAWFDWLIALAAAALILLAPFDQRRL